MSIVLLDPKTINKIAAGEVIECPASVVKELVENSIDAEATSVSITVECGGRNLILVSDDGVGIEKECMEIAFVRHATSKLPDGDLTKIKSLGFRGEGLASIAAVSKIKMISKYQDSKTAWLIMFEGGEKTQELTPNSLSCGTCVEVRDLFFAIPNRLKFLKTEKAEVQSIIDIVNKLAMVNHSVKFSLSVDGKWIFKYLKQQSNIDRLSEIKNLGPEFYKNSLPVNVKEGVVTLTGYIGLPTLSRSKSSLIYTFVNGRPVYDGMLIGAVRYAYSDFIEKNKYPVVVLHLDIPCDQVDVNVHPNKSEVRFQNRKLIYKIVVGAIRDVLSINMRTKLKSIGNVKDDPFIRDSIIKAKYLKDIDGSFSSEFSSVQQCLSNSSDGQKCSAGDLRASKIDRRHFYEDSAEKEVCSFDAYREIDLISSSNNILQQLPSMNATDTITPESSGTLGTKNNKKLEGLLIDDYPLGCALCQIHSRYIISQTRDSIIIVDQHAAHERLTYEYMKQVMEKEGIKRQILLIPEVIEIGSSCDLELLIEYKEKLLQLGLLIEPLSSLSVIVREVPAIFGSFDVKSLVTSILDSIVEVGDTLFLDDKIKDVCGTIACYSSIRSGRKLKVAEMNAILRNMENTSHSGQCNHGRPTYVELSLLELDKLFARR